MERTSEEGWLAPVVAKGGGKPLFQTWSLLKPVSIFELLILTAYCAGAAFCTKMPEKYWR